MTLQAMDTKTGELVECDSEVGILIWLLQRLGVDLGTGCPCGHDCDYVCEAMVGRYMREGIASRGA